MTHLQQTLEKQRAARRPPEDYVVSDEGQAVALTLHVPPIEVWTFLWSYLASAWFDQTEEREKIVLTFPRHVIVVEGQNLDRVMAEIGAMRLQGLRVGAGSEDSPRRSETGKTVIAKIIVQEAGASLVSTDIEGCTRSES